MTTKDPKVDATVQWIPGGPEIPTEVLEALEDGDLVFFCGAGVSVPAGLPLFKGLVERIYEQLPDKPADAEALIKSEQYDRALYALELTCGRENVRRRVPAILRLSDGADRSTHQALLELATGREGALRLVTTNFDLAFEGLKNKFPTDCAPKLPIPKKERWKSLVYLHGRLDPDDQDCTNLVLTSADFGLAYLTERWASRFVSELFRRFKILFVGYSVDDPVMRYMMDAFAADRAIGEGVNRAFAFVSASRASSERVAREWRLKGIVPILYDTSDGTHDLLHHTIKYWAERHRSGMQGKEAVVRENADKPQVPAAISQVCWALRDHTGTPARAFASLNPCPPLEWLSAFDKEGLLSIHMDPKNEPLVPMVSGSPEIDGAPHIATLHLVDWLVNYLDNPQLVDWVIEKGTYVHSSFRSRVRQALTNTRLTAPLHQFWTIVSSEDYSLGLHPLSLRFDVIEQLASGSWDAGLRYDLVLELTPILLLKPPWIVDDSDVRLSRYTQGEVVLRMENHIQLILTRLTGHPQRNQILIDLADVLTSLVKRVMDLYELVDKATTAFDLTYIERPSIDDHHQNPDVRSWLILVPLLRDAFLLMQEHDPNQARGMVERWRSLGFPLFRRFVYYAMAKTNVFEPKACLDALLEGGARWLWLTYTQRETFQLLESLWPRLENDDAVRLVRVVLEGPKRELFREDTAEGVYASIVEHEVFIRLRALEQTGKSLPADAQARLDQLRERWEPREAQPVDRDHFPAWTEASFGGPFRPPIRIEDDLRRKSDNEALAVLADIEANRQYLPSWTLLIGEQTERAVRLVVRLANESSIWPPELWQVLMSAVPGSDRNIELWTHLCPLLSHFPEHSQIADGLAFPLREMSKLLPLESEECFWVVWDRTVGIVVNRPVPEPSLDLLMMALNSPPGALAESALNRIDARKPATSANVPDVIWNKLTTLIQPETASASLAATILASRLGALFKLNRDWVRDHLCRKLDWTTNPYARGPWQGYLWQFTLPPDLWQLIKQFFLAAVGRSTELGRAAEAAASWFAAICIDRPEWITHGEATVALQSMTEGDRGTVARVLWRRLEQAGPSADQLWREQIGPWVNAVWPRNQELVGSSSSLNLALAAVSTHEEFPNAVGVIREFTKSSPYFDHVIETVLEKNGQLPRRYPRQLLELLSLVVDNTYRWPNPRFRNLLIQIVTECSDCRETAAYRDLDDYLRRFSL